MFRFFRCFKVLIRLLAEEQTIEFLGVHYDLYLQFQWSNSFTFLSIRIFDLNYYLCCLSFSYYSDLENTLDLQN